MDTPYTENSRKAGPPRSRHLVFTSAGDNANLHYWLKGRRNFDLWVTYYGDEKDRYKDISDFYNVRKGGKFPNLHHVYKKWGDILAHYESIIVMDDDIIIDGSAINRLFEIRRKYDLWLLQPAFDPRGKISFSVTLVRPFTFLRYTNFVEVACPLFRKDKLDGFMKVYDPVLVGWGIEWWFLESLGQGLKNRVAVIDAVTCINPHDRTKGGQREIDRLQETDIRIKNWEEIKMRYNIRSQEQGVVEFDALRKPLTVNDYINSAKVCLIMEGVRLGRTYRRIFPVTSKIRTF